MEHSIALVTGATSRLGYAAARLLAIEGYHDVIVSGRSRTARSQGAATQLAAETGTQVFTLLELIKQGRRVDCPLLNTGMVPGKERVLTAAGVETAQATLSGHHQLPFGLLHSPSN